MAQENDNTSDIPLHQQRDILKVLILIEDSDMEKRNRFIQRLQYINKLIDMMGKSYDNPEDLV